MNGAPDGLTQASWWLLFALGAFHGVNPAMGWLFAVARGLQEHRRREVWRALLPLGAGHVLAVGAAVAVAVAVGRNLPLDPLRWLVAALLVGLGARRLVRHRHPRLAGLRVGAVGLTVWSFLMASAHGAGLMVVPLLLGGERSAIGGHAHHAPAAGGLDVALTATAVHAVGYLLVSAAVAVLVYEKLGLRFLRTGWFNLDLLWALALIVTGAATPWV